VTKIYQHNLFSGTGKKALAYLQQKRQLNCATIEQFELGCAINHQQLTSLFLSDAEKIRQLVSINLLRTSKGNQIHDFFSEGQLVFPLQNEKGKIIAFAARQVEDSK
jgi:DNA primase